MKVEDHPDPRWVAELAGRSLEAGTEAIAEAAAQLPLFRHLARKHREGGRPGYVEIDAPLELFALARLIRPREVVEVGVSSGVSSAYLLEALERNGRGRLHSIDLPKRNRPRSGRPTASWSLPEGKSPGWAIPKRLRHRWDLRIGDKRDLIPAVTSELDRIDLFLYDVPHRDRESQAEFRWVDRTFRSGSVAIADHGPGGELCTALRRWAGERGSEALQCQDLGLYGFRSA